MRITATVAALVLVALTAAGLVVYLIEAQRLHAQTVDGVDRVLDEFQQEAAESQAPSLDRLFRVFLEKEVATGEQVFATIDSTTGQVRKSDEDPVLDDPSFRDAVDPIVRDGGSVRIDSDSGPLLVSSQPVRFAQERGAFLVVSNLSEDRNYLSDTVRTYAVVSALSFLVVVGVAFWQSGRLLRPLRTVRETAEEISVSDLSRRLPVRGNDDITALTRTINGMLDRLQAAFVGQRQFLDDAGHELKTPLTVLRGHLELLDTGSPGEVHETRDLLLDETDRMARLVGDLMLLAKSARPDFLASRPVALAPLTETVLAKATGLGARDWVLDATADETVDVDEQRITQALLQLADNAVKHTRDGDEIGIGSSSHGRLVQLWVRDTGRGVSHEDRVRIFDRFGRAEVLEGDEGFGLGLSIVTAIAEAHDGAVRLDETCTDGARFVITLPRRAERNIQGTV